MTPPEECPIPVLLIGAGHMGRIHAQRLSESGRFRLVAIADLDRDRAESLARSHQVPWACDFRQCVRSASAAVIATSTADHFQIALELLGAGLDLLVEKPVTSCVRDAKVLVGLPCRSGRVLHVGHVEWFNPAVVAVREQIRQPDCIRIVRHGLLRRSTADVNVVWDLMLHDLHLVLNFVNNGMPIRMEAAGKKVVCDSVDVASVRLEFADGCVVELEASRVSETKTRLIEICQQGEQWTLDLLSHRVQVRRGNVGEMIVLDDRDAIEAEHHAFADAIGGKPKAELALEGVLPALELAAAISSRLA